MFQIENKFKVGDIVRYKYKNSSSAETYKKHTFKVVNILGSKFDLYIVQPLFESVCGNLGFNEWNLILVEEAQPELTPEEWFDRVRGSNP